MEIPDKEFCELIIYEKLSIEDPKEYPKQGDRLPYSITPEGGSCKITKPEYSYTKVIQDCDCSDPKNYDFYDKGRF